MATSHDITTFGRRLLPHIVDGRARSGYERPYALFPRSRDPSEGFQSISYACLANAVNRACWWLDAELSRDDEKEHPFAYLGPNDLRYIIFVIATMKTGRKILIPSLRNTVEAQISLFEKANSKILVSCSSLVQSLQPLFSASNNVRKVQAPQLDHLLDQSPVPNYEYNETFESASDFKFLFVHTSGSSGNPRPISWNKTFIASLDTGNILPEGQGTPLLREFIKGHRTLVLLPCFHVSDSFPIFPSLEAAKSPFPQSGGLCYNMYPAFYEMTLVLGHPDVPTSAHYASQLLKLGVIKSMLTPPSILEDLSKDPTAVQDLAKLTHVAYAGGPLQPKVGNKLAPILPHLFSIIGATEYGWFHNISGDNDRWQSLNFYSDIGYRFEEVSEGLFELLIINDEKTNKYHGIFETFPGIREYRTRDLYTSEPQGWWHYRGRADDIIVLSNGEKINPIPMENIIRSHPSVKAALVIGEYRFNPSLLVEMEADFVPRTETEKREALNEIWPTVQEANNIAPGFAKIPKSLMLFADAEKPFMRAGKGTVQRQNTVKAYSTQLGHLFSSQELGLLTEGLTIKKSPSPENIKTFTREIYVQAMEMHDLKDSDNVFERGIDSLRVTVVAQRLDAALQLCEVSLNGVAVVDPRLVYSAPSIAQMAEVLISLSRQREAALTTNETISQSRQKNMEHMLDKYSNDLPSTKSQADVRSPLINGTKPGAMKIILTGTTGSLGSYLLAALEALPKTQVAKMFCLNRSANSQEKQRKSSATRGLNASWDNERVQFLQSDLSQPDLGLSANKYTELLQETTVIIHCSWKVDFNLTIESLDPQIRGVRNLLSFSAVSSHKAPVVFISSISTVLGWLGNNPKNVAPEAVVHDFDAPENVGYGESKYISELLLERFSKNTGITSVIFRVGQIAGPLSEKGSWNKQEWFPSVMASSKYMNILPETLGNMEVIDWIPVDLLSTIVVELIQHTLTNNRRDEGETIVYNLVNPQIITWPAFLPSVQRLSGIAKVVSLKTWVKRLEESSKEHHGAVTEHNPAVKLLEYFRALSEKNIPPETGSRYDVSGLVRDSKQASNLEAVSPEWLKLWIEQWNF